MPTDPSLRVSFGRTDRSSCSSARSREVTSPVSSWRTPVLAHSSTHSAHQPTNLFISHELDLPAELRNERAHENAFLTDTGRAATILPDGSIIEIDLPDVSWRCTILRSFLDGVDVAVNVASAAIGDRSTWRPPQSRPPTSLKLLEHVVANLAGRLTDGSVERLGIADGSATMASKGLIGMAS